jgi:hypothetical protein
MGRGRWRNLHQTNSVIILYHWNFRHIPQHSKRNHSSNVIISYHITVPCMALVQLRQIYQQVEHCFRQFSYHT